MDGTLAAAKSVGEVRVIETNKSISITLNCICSVGAPKWDLYSHATKGTTTVSSPVECTNNGNSCNPSNYIAPGNESEGHYVSLNHTFYLNDSAVLMCYSRSEREVLVVHFSKEFEGVCVWYSDHK